MPNPRHLARLTASTPPLPEPMSGATPVGTAIPALAAVPSDDTADLKRLAAELLQDPLAMQQLRDRVYDLLEADLRRQRERIDH